MQEVLLLFAVLLYSASAELEPRFNTTPEHVIVKARMKAILPCTVEYIGSYKVIWVTPRPTLISLGDRRMIDDQRISVERPYIKEWNLHIREVRHNDSGVYQCQINTKPVQVKNVTLSVQVPPMIISKLSSDNIKLREGDTATLVCNVTGIPHPNVTWYKRNYRQGRGHKERIGLEGETLIIHNVTRYCDDIYECFVDNGVPPAVSKAIRVVVEFAPEVMIPTKRLGQSLGRETILECTIYAHPQGVTAWKKDGRRIPPDNVEAYPNIESRIVTLSVRINRLEREDFGRYTCEGKNFLGSDEEDMILYEIEPEVSISTTSTTAGPRYEVMLPDAEKSLPGHIPTEFDEKDPYQDPDTENIPSTTAYSDYLEPGKTYIDNVDPRVLHGKNSCAYQGPYSMIFLILTSVSTCILYRTMS